MSGYADDYKDMEQVRFVHKWVPEDDIEPLSVEQYRYVLACCRAAEADVQRYQRALREFGELLRGIVR